MTCSVASTLVAALALGASAANASKSHNWKKEALLQLDLARDTQPVQRATFPLEGENSSFRFNFADQGSRIDNAAVLQLQVTKNELDFLSTQSKDGLSQFLTVLKPCGILLPHVHPRSNEFFSVVFGTMNAGIAQENNFLQDISIDIRPGEVFVVPQGLLHHNHNQECEPLVFFQSFDSADSGALNVIGALAAFNDAGGNGAAAMLASGAESIEASPQGAFALDQQCLKRCKFPDTGAPGDGLDDLPDVLRAVFGI